MKTSKLYFILFLALALMFVGKEISLSYPKQDLLQNSQNGGLNLTFDSIPQLYLRLKKINSSYYDAEFPISVDSGTGITYKTILHVSLGFDTMEVDSIDIFSNCKSLYFRTLDSQGKQNPFPNYIMRGTVYNINKNSCFDLELMFDPPKTQLPGEDYLTLWFVSGQLNERGYVRVVIPLLITHNPHEWFDSTKIPGIELELISSKNDTTNLIFGTGYNVASDYSDENYGFNISSWKPSKFLARFIFECKQNKCYDYIDYAPNYENRYSDSRCIYSSVNYKKPYLYFVSIYATAEEYPIKIEYGDYNFPDNLELFIGKFPMDNESFYFDMRSAPKISNEKYQYIITDTNVKKLVIAYSLSSKLIFTKNPTYSIYKTVYCPGDTLFIGYEVMPIFNKDNEFICELSDTSGLWNQNVREIGRKKTTFSGVFEFIIPNDILESTLYKFRVRSTSPLYSLSENEIKTRIFPGKPHFDSIIYVMKGEYLKIHPSSPKFAYFKAFDSAIGGNEIYSGLYELVIGRIYEDVTFYVEAKSQYYDCITPVRQKITIKVTPNSVENEFDKNFNSKLIISPNPNSGKFDLFVKSDFTGNASFEIYNLLGKKVFENNSIILSSGLNTIPINLDLTSPGYYLLKFNYNNTYLSQKFIIRKNRKV